MGNYKGININKTKAGKYYVPVLHKNFRTLETAKRAVDRWVHRQYQRDKPWLTGWKMRDYE